MNSSSHNSHILPVIFCWCNITFFCIFVSTTWYKIAFFAFLCLPIGIKLCFLLFLSFLASVGTCNFYWSLANFYSLKPSHWYNLRKICPIYCWGHILPPYFVILGPRYDQCLGRIGGCKRRQQKTCIHHEDPPCPKILWQELFIQIILKYLWHVPNNFQWKVSRVII